MKLPKMSVVVINLGEGILDLYALNKVLKVSSNMVMYEKGKKKVVTGL